MDVETTQSRVAEAPSGPTERPADKADAGSAPAPRGDTADKPAKAVGEKTADRPMGNNAKAGDGKRARQPAGAKNARPRLTSRIVRILRIIFFASLTRRIVFLNLVALVVLLSGILYLNQFREGLIDAKVQSLLTQGRIIAGAIASSATVETDSIMIDPDKLLDLQAGDSISPTLNRLETLDFADQARKGRAGLCDGSSRRRERARASTTATAS